jgi:hypothetical protein
MWSREAPRSEEFPMTEPLVPRKCQLYWPGHLVHWIQGRHWAKDTPIPVSDLQFVDGWVQFTCDGERLTRWNHDLSDLQRLVIDSPRATITYSARWRILAVAMNESRTEHRLFYLATEQTDCDAHLFERITSQV